MLICADPYPGISTFQLSLWQNELVHTLGNHLEFWLKVIWFRQSNILVLIPSESSGFGNSPTRQDFETFLFMRSFITFFRTLEQSLATFYIPCYTSATCQTTLVLVGLVMQEIMLAFHKFDADEDESQTSLEFSLYWQHSGWYYPSEHTCDLFDALLPAALTGWKRHVLVNGVATFLTYIRVQSAVSFTAWVGYNNFTVPK